MTRFVPPALQAHFELPVTTRAQCIKLKRADGLILGFAMFDADITFDLGDGDGPIVYKANSALSISAIRRQIGLAPDNGELAGVFEDGRITKKDLRARRYDGAECVTFEVNWAELTQGRMKLGRFKLGKVELRDTGYTIEILSFDYAYSQTIGRVTEVACDADVGDSRCKVRMGPPAWASVTPYTVRPARDAGLGSVVKPSVQNGRQFRCVQAGASGAVEPVWNTALGGDTNDGTVIWRAFKANRQVGTVTAVANLANFTASGVSLGADHWTLGVITWLTGENVGLKEKVKADNGAGVLQVYAPMPLQVQIGDTFAITAGCDKSDQGTHGCRVKFDNIWNDRGLRFAPGSQVATNYGTSSGSQ